MNDPAREQVLKSYDVSRETTQALDAYVAQLLRWQTVKNLVGPSTLSEVWSRHVADALQLLTLAPEARTWIDLGSGAGIPGLILAIAGKERGIRVTLVESNTRKCAFLTEAARLTGAPATIRNGRIEAVIGDAVETEIVCARALAALDQLLDWSAPLLKSGTIGLFPKGRDVQAELTQASTRWRVTYDLVPSRTDADARIVRVTALTETSPR